MKKLIIILSFLFASMISFGQFIGGEFVKTDTLFVGNDTIINNVLTSYDSTGFRLKPGQVTGLKTFVNSSETDPVYSADTAGLTTNYVIKKKANGFANSIIFDNGTNVGIGVAPSTVKLNVYGSIATNTNPISGLTNVVFANGTSINQNNPSAYSMAFKTGNPPIENVYIINTGRVGIGTPTPTEKLQVNGNIKGDTIKGYLSNELDPKYSADSSTIKTGVRSWNSSLAKTIDTADTTYWGRAETDPAYNASVSHGITATDTAIWNSAMYGVNDAFYIPGGSGIQYNFKDRHNSTVGSVAITNGTSDNPGLLSPLNYDYIQSWINSIAATIDASDTTRWAANSGTPNTSTTGYILKNENDTIKNSILSESGANIVQATRVNALYSFGRKEATGEGAIINSRNLGSVNWEGWDSDSYYRGARIQGVSTENYGPTAGGTKIALFTTANGTQTLSEKFTFLGDGNLGIGSTTPMSKLVAIGSVATNNYLFNFVNSDINKNRSTITQATDTSSFNGRSSSTGNITIDLKSKTGTSLFHVDSTGVGIGTTSPAYGLDVNGSARVQGNFYRESRKIISDPFEYGQCGTLNYVLVGQGVNSVPLWTPGAIFITSPANGDIIYYNSGWQKLAKGTNGQSLTLVSGLPSWVTCPYITDSSYIKTGIRLLNANSTAWTAKQAALVSGTNIKTINGSSILGSGDLAVTGASQWTTDTYGVTYSNSVGVGAASNSSARIYAYTTGLTSAVHGDASFGYGVYGTSNYNYGGVFSGLGVLATHFRINAMDTAPATSTSAGEYGEIRITSTGIYICIANNAWIKCVGADW